MASAVLPARSAPPQARPVPGSLSASPPQADGHVPTRVPLNHRGYVAPLAHGAGRTCLSSRRRAEAAPAPGRGPGRPALRHCGRPASAEGTAPASGCSGPGCAPGSRARGQDLGSSDPGSVTGEHVPPPAPRPALRSPTLGPRLTPDAGLRGGTGPLPLPPFLPRPLPGPRRSRAHAASHSSARRWPRCRRPFVLLSPQSDPDGSTETRRELTFVPSVRPRRLARPGTRAGTEPPLARRARAHARRGREGARPLGAKRMRSGAWRGQDPLRGFAAASGRVPRPGTAPHGNATPGNSPERSGNACVGDRRSRVPAALGRTQAGHRPDSRRPRSGAQAEAWPCRGCARERLYA